MAGTPTSFDWQATPSHLNLDTTIPATFTADDLDMGSFSARSGSMPSIAIDECEPFPNFSTPSSPVPSLWLGTTRASSPDSMPPGSALPQFGTAYPPMSKPMPSSIEPHTAPSWEFMAQASSSQLQPGTSSRGHSRKTSTSSLSQASNEQAMSPIPEVEDDILLWLQHHDYPVKAYSLLVVRRVLAQALPDQVSPTAVVLWQPLHFPVASKQRP
ncbi:unnamed protein product [Alternaria alternata]